MRFGAVVLFFYFLSIARAAQIALTPTESKYVELVKSYRQALIKVFLDSTQEASETDVLHVKRNFGLVAENFKSFVIDISALYTIRSRQLDNTVSPVMYKVGSTALTTDSNLDDFFKELAVESAVLFYQLPPGRFRGLVRQHFLSASRNHADPDRPFDCVLALYNHILSHPKDFAIPYKAALGDVREMFTRDALLLMKGKLDRLHYLNETVFCQSQPRISAQLSSAIRVPIFAQEFLALVLPANTFQILCDRDGEKWAFTPANANLPVAVPLECILKFEVLRLTDPIVNGHVNVIDSLAADIQPLVALCDKTNFANFETDDDNSVEHILYPAIVGSVLKRNPEALFINPACIKIEDIKYGTKLYAKSILETIVTRLRDGRLHKVDGSVICDLIDKVDGDWDRLVFSHVIFNHGKEENAHDAAVGNSLLFPRIASLPKMTGDIMGLLPFVPAAVSKAFHQSCFGGSLANLKIFMDALCDGLGGHRAIIGAFRKLKSLKAGVLTPRKIEAAQVLFLELLRKEEIDQAIICNYLNINPEEKSLGKVPDKTQEPVILSLFFSCGSFAQRRDASPSEAVYWEACETIAWLLYPDYVDRVKTVRFHAKGDINVLFNCHFILQDWVFEHYGVVTVAKEGRVSMIDDDDPRSMARLFSPNDGSLQKLHSFIKKLFFTRKCPVLIDRLFNVLDQFVLFKRMDLMTNFVETFFGLSNCIDVEEVVKCGCSDLTQFQQDLLGKYSERCRNGSYLVNEAARQSAKIQSFVQKLDEGGMFDTDAVAKEKDVKEVVGTLFRREFERDLRSVVTWRRDSIRRILAHLNHEPRLTMWTINRGCLLARCPEDFDIFFSLDHTTVAPFLTIIGHPKVDLQFKVYCASIPNISQEDLCQAVSHAWWHCLSMTKDKFSATKLLMEKCKFFDFSLEETQIHECLFEHNTLPPSGLLSLQKKPFSEIVENGENITLFVHDTAVLIPSNATVTHLYAVVSCLFPSTAPFVLVDKYSNNVIKIDSCLTMKDLTSYRLEFKPVSLEDMLFMD